MNGLDDLRAVLRRVASEGVAPAGEHALSAPEDALAVIVRQIDATVLGRVIAFDFEGRGRLLCEASGRRLLRLVPPVPDGLGPEAEALAGTPLSGAEEDHLEALAALLSDLAAGASRLRVSSAPRGDGTETGETGISAARLAEALGVGTALAPKPAGGDALAALVEGLEAHLRAAFRASGAQITVLKGDGALIETLTGWSETALEGLVGGETPPAAELREEGLLLFGLPAPAGGHLAVAGQSGDMLIALLDDAGLAPAMRLWQSVRAT